MVNKIGIKHNHHQMQSVWDPIIVKLLERANIGQLLQKNGTSDKAIEELWNWYDYT